MAVKSGFSLVCFPDEDNSVMTIPDEWIYGTTSCKYPHHLSGRHLEKAIKEIWKPTKGWTSYNIKILKSRSMFTPL